MKNHKQTEGENKNDQCDIFCLDDAYSTTRRITTCPPDPDNKPDDAFETVLFLPEGTERNGEGGLRTKGYFKKSQADRPLVSIITVVFNGDKFLEETIQSVIRQSYENVEYIVIDGGSTDKTLDVIKKYEGQIDYWVSEKDDGIYYAMNKGLNASTGDIIGIINSGDYYTKKSIEIVSSYYTNEYMPNNIIITGNMLKINSTSQCLFKSKKTLKDLDNISLAMPINHPSTFIPVYIYKKLGIFDPIFKICADYELVFRFFSNKVQFVFLDYVITKMRLGGISESLSTLTIRSREYYRIQKRYAPKENCMCNTFLFFIKNFCKLALKILFPSLSQIYYLSKK